MKYRSRRCSSRCCCCFCCCCWLIMLLVASSVVKVSPEISTSTTMYGNNRQHSPAASTTTKFETINYHGSKEVTPASATTTKTTTIRGTKTMAILMELSAATGPSKMGTHTASATATTIFPQIDTNINISNTSRITMSNQHQHQQQQLPTTTSLARTTTATPTRITTRTMASSSAVGTTHISHWPQHSMHEASPHFPLLSSSLNHQFKRPTAHRRWLRQAEAEQPDKCRLFVEGEPGKNELYSPDYPNNYPKNINCTRVITAPKGQIIRLDFRNSFHIEAKEECKFDFLEVRDGQYGFSNLLGKFCGSDFPPEITSKERYLWLHFHSDESIEYSGFTAVYEFIDRSREAPSTDLNCTIEINDDEGKIGSKDVPEDIKDTVMRNKIPLDCMWRIKVKDNWKIQVKFEEFKLSKPNDCETNFLDIFPEETVMPLRVKNFCGSAGEGITSDSNILHMRFYAEQSAINSTFLVLYTAFRDKGSGTCEEDEYDCEDATCIAGSLRCNGNANCKFRWDEEHCKDASKDENSEHMTIIITVFGLILGGMVLTFVVNCVRKIMRDQKIIREHIRQSKESKLDEMGRNSKARSRDNISAVMSPRQKHSQTSLQILDDVANRYYREVVPISVQTSKADLKEKEHSILRQHHDMIVQTSLCGGDDDSSTTTTDPPARGNRGGGGIAMSACDMGCQTRESLFAPSNIDMRQKSISSMGGGSGGIRGVPPPPRFSTFGYEMQQAPPPPGTLSHRHSIRSTHGGSIEQHDHNAQQQQQQQATHHPGHYMATAPVRAQEMCHHHHQHQQHLQQQKLSANQQTLPHGQRSGHHQQPQQQQQHPAHHHTPQQQQIQQQSKTIIPMTVLATPPTTTSKSTPHSAASGKSKQQQHQQQKVDESKVFIDIRNSAPDVIIMTSH